MHSKAHFKTSHPPSQMARKDSMQVPPSPTYLGYGRMQISRIRKPVPAAFVKEASLPAGLAQFLTSMDLANNGSGEESLSGNHPARFKIPVKMMMELDPFVNVEEFLEEGLMPEGALRSEDLVFLSDCAHCWVIRLSDISILEAEENYTRAFMNSGSVLIRRPLRECALRLDPHLFFRARRSCIVNLGQVRQARFADAVRLVFVFHNGKEVVLSRKQSLVFRRTRSL